MGEGEKERERYVVSVPGRNSYFICAIRILD